MNRINRKVRKAWRDMMNRCYDSNDNSYSRYGGVGIEVSLDWHIFEIFLSDIGLPKDEIFSLDRIDNKMGYSKNNCRWATKTEQQNNRNCNLRIHIDGETKTAKEWSRDTRCKVSYISLVNRLKRGWSNKDAVFLENRFGNNLIKSKKNYYITINGIEKTIRGWSIDPICSVPYSTIMSRIQRGVNAKDAILKRVL
jgi:hypothetical protein